MRARLLLVFLVGGTTTALAALQACGLDVESSPDDDAGQLDVEAGAASDAPAEAATCDTQEDLLTGIPDAAIADGASTSGLCLGCVRAVCGTFVDACNKSCDCRRLVGDALGCVLRTQAASLTLCAAPLLSGDIDSETQQLGLSFALCVTGACEEACALGAFRPDGGGDAGDAGPADAGDAGLVDAGDGGPADAGDPDAGEPDGGDAGTE